MSDQWHIDGHESRPLTIRATDRAEAVRLYREAHPTAVISSVENSVDRTDSIVIAVCYKCGDPIFDDEENVGSYGDLHSRCVDDDESTGA